MTFGPLNDFAFRGRPAPYTAPEGRVVPVQCKVGLAVSRYGGTVHIIEDAAAIFLDGKAQFGARFQCGKRSCDVILVKGPEDFHVGCVYCEGIVAGPCVYRCFSATGELLYIGSSVSRHARMLNHARRPWWQDVAEVKYEDFPTVFEARNAEIRAIRTEHPARNRHHKVRAS